MCIRTTTCSNSNKQTAVIYTYDVGTAAVFRAILSNANDQADNFSFAGHRAKTWKRRNTVRINGKAFCHLCNHRPMQTQGRIGVGAFRRTTLQIGSYTGTFLHITHRHVRDHEYSCICIRNLLYNRGLSWEKYEFRHVCSIVKREFHWHAQHIIA